MFLKKLGGVRIVGRERGNFVIFERQLAFAAEEAEFLIWRSSLGVPHLPTMCPTSFSFSVQTYSPMSSPASSSEALVIFQGFA